jgi:hypothetical protein
MPDIRRTTRREKTFRAWAGESAEVERLAVVLQNLLDRRIKTLDGDQMGHPGVSLTFRDGSDEVAGPWHEILPEMDPRTVSEFSLMAVIEAEDVEEERAVLEFARKPSSDSPEPIRLQVFSVDQGWARQAFVTLQEELEKGVPRWNLVHSHIGSIAFGWSLFLSTTFVLFRLISLLPLRSASNPEEMAAKDWVITVSAIAVTIFFLSKSGAVREWFFPRLEIVRNGSNQTSARRLALLGTLAAELLVGIVVNLIS